MRGTAVGIEEYSELCYTIVTVLIMEVANRCRPELGILSTSSRAGGPMNLSVRGLKSEMRYRHFQVRYSRTLKRIWNWTHTPPESLRWSDIEDFFKAWEREYFFGPCKF